MRIQRFEELICWQKAKLLYVELNQIFSAERDYFFKDQLIRAALSISNNIAKVFDRTSDRELSQFLIIARVSSSEVRSVIYIAEAVKKLTSRQEILLVESIEEIPRLITGFVQELLTSDKRLGTG